MYPLLLNISAGAIALIGCAPVALAITFTPPPGPSPINTRGGASRGAVIFVPAKGGKLSTAGGGSRNKVIFRPTRGKGVTTVGGGSRLPEGVHNPTPSGHTPLSTAPGSTPEGPYPEALIALVPPNSLGLTLAERPRLLVYLPASPATQATFSLKDQAGRVLYAQEVAVTGEAGVIQLQLPASAPALAENQLYQWFFALKVDGRLTPATPTVDGWLQRVSPSATLTKALQVTDPLQQATALAAHGIWYDCAATLAEATQAVGSEQQNLRQEWSRLLALVGLRELQSVPVRLGPRP